jgi:hypothetical protein
VARARGFAVLTVGVAVLIAAGSATTTLARFSDAAAASGSVVADTLAPPTSLAAAGGTDVDLSWIATVDTYATGYALYRSSTSGSGYGFVANVTPGTAVATTDAPALGTWYYVLRSVYQSWDSADSNEVSAVVGTPTSTTYAACVSQAADTSGAGDNNGYQNNPARACVDDSSDATDPSSGTGGTQSCGTGATPDARKDRHRFWGFSTGLPGSVTSIEGIRVRADLGMNNNGGTTAACAQLSWDGGTTWTTLQSVTLSGTAEATYTFGGVADLWGRGAWTLSELSSANFRIRLVDASSQTNKRFDLDYLAVSVTYVP